MNVKSIILAFLIVTCPTATINARTMEVKGTVTDTQGRPLLGIVISDGYSCVQTDSKGHYRFTRHEAAYYVHYSIPAEYEVPLRYGTPTFFKKLDRDSVYNFVLIPKKKGADKEFSIFFMADPQCQNIRHVRRFHCETVADIKKFAKKTRTPNYGITLGDIGYTEGEFNTTYILPLMKEEMREENIGMPVFQTNGNHDQLYNGLALDEQNPNAMIRFKRMFEDLFGPINYSWNRGSAHIISMDNVMYDVLNTASKYHGELSEEQINWLRKDLSFVPKDKLIIFCCHIPVYSMKNKKALLALLAGFENRVIFSGHIHTNTFYRHEDGTKEYNLAAASGCWWWSRCNGDGTPNGYKVVTVSGNKIINQFWKSTGFDKNFQIRMYHGNSRFGGPYEECQLPFGKDIVLANVFAWDEEWKVEVYENNQYKGMMDRMTPTHKEDQHPSLKSSKDWWAIGYNTGVVGRGHIGTSNRNSYINSCTHMFMYKMSDPHAKIRIVATDPYGNKYQQTNFIDTDAFQPGNTVYADDTPPVYPDDPVWK